MSTTSSSPAASPRATVRLLLPPLVAFTVAIWGLASCWRVSLLGYEIGKPLAGWLSALLGADGVEPGRDLLERAFFMVALASAIWLLLVWNPPRGRADPHLESVVLDLKVGTGTLLMFLTCLGAALVFLVRNLFGGPGSWLDDTFGPPSLGLGGVVMLGLLTLLLGLALRSIHRRLRNNPVYGTGSQRQS